MVKALSVRLPQALTKALDQVATVVDRPRSYLIRKAIEAYLEEYADYQVALDRLRDKDDLILSSHDFKVRLGV